MLVLSDLDISFPSRDCEICRVTWRANVIGVGDRLLQQARREDIIIENVSRLYQD
jgi:hypothetical protein